IFGDPLSFVAHPLGLPVGALSPSPCVMQAQFVARLAPIAVTTHASGVLPSMRPRALPSAISLCLLVGCASAKPGAQPSNDAAGKDLSAATDAGVTDAPADGAPSGSDAPASSDALVTIDLVVDLPVTADAPPSVD